MEASLAAKSCYGIFPQINSRLFATSKTVRQQPFPSLQPGDYSQSPIGHRTNFVLRTIGNSLSRSANSTRDVNWEPSSDRLRRTCLKRHCDSRRTKGLCYRG